MSHPRDEILEWAEQQRIAPQNLRRALDLAEALPTSSDWRVFLDRMLLWMGSVLVASGVIFFFAYNWRDLDRFAKFGLIQAFIVVALVLVWRLGLDRLAAKATLLAAALLVGALLALIGQTYQTGADTFELFATWAAAILPWVLIGRFAALWLLWLAILNLAAMLYFEVRGGMFGVIFGPERYLWVLFALNTAALAAWEWLAAGGIEWLRQRWAVRIVATASGAFVTALALFDIFEWRSAGGWGPMAWLVWLAAAYAVYRMRIKDLFVLAGGVLSVIVVVASFLGKHFVRGDAGAFLFIGLVVIGLSAAGGWWLKNIAAEEDK